PVGESGYSNEASAMTETTPNPPTGLTATGGNGQVLLSWTAPSVPVTYTVMRALQPGGRYDVLARELAPTTYTDLAVVNGTTYYYVVFASNSAGDSGPSNQASGTPHPTSPPPATPTG